MKLKEGSVIRIYSTALTDQNLLDYKPAGWKGMTREVFKGQFDQQFDLLQISGSGITSYPLQSVRAVKYTDGIINLVVPAVSNALIDKNLLRCICDDGSHYFDIISISSLNDNSVNPSTEIMAAENYYYTNLYEIQMGMNNVQATFARHHVKRIETGLDPSTTPPTPYTRIASGIEGNSGLSFNSTITSSEKQSNLLWLYVTVDEDTTVSAKYKDSAEVEKLKYDINTPTAFSMGRRVFAFPYGFFYETGIKPATEIYSRNIGIVDIKLPSGIVFNEMQASHIVDAYISNAIPPFDYQVSGEKIYITNAVWVSPCDPEGQPLIYSAEVGAKKAFGMACFNISIESTEIPSRTVANTGKFTYSKIFGDIDAISDLKSFESGVNSDPSLGLYPFVKIFTVTGEIVYFPTRTKESFKSEANFYYRSFNNTAASYSSGSQLFYLNFWDNCNGFVFLQSSNIETFYRNNGSQYREKMGYARIKAVTQIAEGGISMATGVSGLTGNVTKTYKDVQLRNARGQFTGKTKRMLSGTSTDPVTNMQILDATSGGGAGIVTGAVDLVHSFTAEEALKADLANAQDDYQNVVSQTFPSCQILYFMKSSPNTASEEYKNIIYNIYYYGYVRKDIDILGNNYRNVYDFKQCSSLYSKIVSSNTINDFVVSILTSGTTFWHLETVSGLSDSIKKQIAETGNKYGIANYEPELD